MKDDPDLDLKTRDAYTDWITNSIRYSDLDPNGHVNNGAINAFFEDGRVQFRSNRISHCSEDILVGFVLVKLTVEYLSPLKYPGSVDIGTLVSKVGKTSYDLKQGIFCGQNCVAVGEVVTVCFNNKTQKPKKISDDLRAILTGKRKW